VLITQAVPEGLLRFAVEMADASGVIARRHFRTAVAVETKPDQTPVTAVDREIESRLREMIDLRYPGHGVYGEEFRAENVDAEYVWVLDPIDGTRSFITGVPMFGTLIALLHRGVPIVGVIDHPAIGDRWIGSRGNPTLYNSRPVRSRACAIMGQATVLTSTPDYYRGRDIEVLTEITRRTMVVLYGTECMAYGLVASAFADIVVEAGMDPFDFLAAVPVIEGAGGRITDWRGRALGIDSGDKVLACGDPDLHGALLEMLESRCGDL
jgi:inositol-phosphate phosphatase / L-galactose 1-phosphate phosphatase / histidinol-phosphatase